MVTLSYRFRLYPCREHQELLRGNLDVCRWLYNHFLAQVRDYRDTARAYGWDSFRGIPSRYDLQAQLPKLKKAYPFLKQVNSKVLQMVLHQLYSNITALSRLKYNGRKVGMLRFKGKNRYKTLPFNQSGFKLEGRTLYLSKIGHINIKRHRPLDGEIKQVKVKRENTGKWFAIFAVEKQKEPLRETGKDVGIDVGVRHFLTDTEGNQVENPNYYEKTLERIRVVQRDFSRKKKGSKNRQKAKTKFNKLHEKLKNQRDDFLHKVSRYYVNNYDLIAVKNLNISGMSRNHILARKILDASWSRFFHMLSYKAESAGRVVVRVDPKGTSEGLGFDDPHEGLYISKENIISGKTRVGTALRACGEAASTQCDRQSGCHWASHLAEAGSPLRKHGVVHRF